MNANTLDFVRRRLRTIARRLLRLHRDATSLKNEYFAQHASALAAEAGATLADGAPDNRTPPMTGQDAIDVAGTVFRKIVDTGGANTGFTGAELNVILKAAGYDDIEGLD